MFAPPLLGSQSPPGKRLSQSTYPERKQRIGAGKTPGFSQQIRRPYSPKRKNLLLPLPLEELSYPPGESIPQILSRLSKDCGVRFGRQKTHLPFPFQGDISLFKIPGSGSTIRRYPRCPAGPGHPRECPGSIVDRVGNRRNQKRFCPSSLFPFYKRETRGHKPPSHGKPRINHSLEHIPSPGSHKPNIPNLPKEHLSGAGAEDRCVPTERDLQVFLQTGKERAPDSLRF